MPLTTLPNKCHWKAHSPYASAYAHLGCSSRKYILLSFTIQLTDFLSCRLLMLPALILIPHHLETNSAPMTILKLMMCPCLQSDVYPLLNNNSSQTLQSILVDCTTFFLNLEPQIIRRYLHCHCPRSSPCENFAIDTICQMTSMQRCSPRILLVLIRFASSQMLSLQMPFI